MMFVFVNKYTSLYHLNPFFQGEFVLQNLFHKALVAFCLNHVFF